MSDKEIFRHNLKVIKSQKGRCSYHALRRVARVVEIDFLHEREFTKVWF